MGVVVACMRDKARGVGRMSGGDYAKPPSAK